MSLRRLLPFSLVVLLVAGIAASVGLTQATPTDGERLAACLEKIARIDSPLHNSGLPWKQRVTRADNRLHEASICFLRPSEPPSMSTEPPPPTTTEPPPPTTTEPSPVPASICTKELAPGGDLSTFEASLVAGDVGCLRGGSYTDGDLVIFNVAGATLTEYPRERAEIVGTQIQLQGSVTLSELTIRDTAVNRSCVGVNGSGASIVHNELLRCARHGVILHTDSAGVDVERNFVDQVGVNETSLSDSQVHGIYVQGPDHRVVRNDFRRPAGYGIHLYSSPSNALVAQNSCSGSLVRTCILIRTSGSGTRVVNNDFERATWHTCASPCLVDSNRVTGGWIVQDEQPLGATNPLTAVVDTARPDFAFFPSLDGVGVVVGAGSDASAYEQ